MARFEGGCACGAVRYRLTAAPMIVHCCHCTDCQRQTGSAFVVNAWIEASQVTLLAGATKPCLMLTESGLPHEIHRCEDCGTALWSHYGGRKYASFVRVGTLDEPAALPPDVHIFTKSKLPWVILPDDVPRYEIYYQREAVWPPESIARLEVAKAKPSQ